MISDRLDEVINQRQMKIFGRCVRFHAGTLAGGDSNLLLIQILNVDVAVEANDAKLVERGLGTKKGLKRGLNPVFKHANHGN